MGDARADRVTCIALAAILVIAAIVRLYALGHAPLWLDEQTQLKVAQTQSAAEYWRESGALGNRRGGADVCAGAALVLSACGIICGSAVGGQRDTYSIFAGSARVFGARFSCGAVGVAAGSICGEADVGHDGDSSACGDCR